MTRLPGRGALCSGVHIVSLSPSRLKYRTCSRALKTSFQAPSTVVTNLSPSIR